MPIIPAVCSLISYFTKAVNYFLALSTYTASDIVPLWSEHVKLSNYRFNATFCHPYSVRISQCIERFFSKPWYRYYDNTAKQKFTQYCCRLKIILWYYDIPQLKYCPALLTVLTVITVHTVLTIPTIPRVPTVLTISSYYILLLLQYIYLNLFQ